MAVKPTLLLSPDGSWDANGRVEPTLTGGVLVVPGQYGNAWQIAEATTNLIPNPGFETGKGAWVSVQGEIDSTDFAPGGGTTSLKVTISTSGSGAVLANTAGPLGTYSIEIAPNTTYTVSFWAKASKAGSYRTYHPWRNSSGSLISTNPKELSAYHDYTTEWQRFSHTFTTPSDATIARTYMALYGTDGHAAGDIVWIDNVQFEAKPYATPYCDGSLGSGHAWTGTPHASSSTRLGSGRVSVANAASFADAEKGTILARAKRFGPVIVSPMFMAIGSASNSYVLLYAVEPDGSVRAYTREGYGSLRTIYGGQPLAIGEPSYVAMTWDTENVSMIKSGEARRSTPRVDSTFAGFGTDGAYIGGPSGFNHDIESVLIFDTALTDAEIAEYTSMGAWTYNSTFGPSTDIVFPDIRSGLHLVETKIHKSDMYGNIGDEITGEVVTAGITSDLDRAGSKTHIDITAVGTANLLPAGSWVTPVQEISREGEGTVQVQRGVFELDQPEVESAGVRFIVSNSGKDIVDLLARSALLDTFYTPVGGHVMSDVELAIRMLGITSIGPNVLPEGSFEGGKGGWNQYTSGGTTAWTMTWDADSTGTSYPPTDGTKMIRVWANSPSNGFSSVWRYMPVPAGSRRMMLTAMVRHPGDGYIKPNLTLGQLAVSGGPYIYNPAFYITPPPGGGWYRIMAIFDIHPEATILQPSLQWRMVEGFTARSGVDNISWDDAQLREVTGDLLPASMLAMPPSSALATSRIQHLTSDPRLAAVNDRLAAIGMMAVNATNDSKYTSRMSRDPNKDAAVRQYDIEKDIRITGDIQTWRNTSNKYNRVFAVKEDYTEGTVMTAIAENKDLDDPWNIYRSVLTPKRIDVRDAVDVETLQLAADQELAKASMQESVSFSIVPDPTLSVYDIIEITGPSTNPAIGKWAIESIDSGLTASDPLMHIGARRTKKGV